MSEIQLGRTTRGMPRLEVRAKEKMLEDAQQVDRRVEAVLAIGALPEAGREGKSRTL